VGPNPTGILVDLPVFAFCGVGKFLKIDDTILGATDEISELEILCASTMPNLREGEPKA
jgi:hypothetical protein